MSADDPHERLARRELEAWRREMLRDPSALERAAKGLQVRVNALIPEKIHAAITKVIEQMTRGILVGSDFVTAEPLRNASLAERELQVRKAITGYRNVASIEGGVTGAGGFLAAAADFPALIAIKIKLLFEIAALYGHDGADWRERLYILAIFQLAFSGPDHRRAIYEAMVAGNHPASPEDFDWRRFQQEYRDYIDLAKLAQMLPVVGAPVGAIVNWRLLERLGETAINAYRLRWFEGRSG
ncbi:EcsC family protein [Caulobacter mirabilis]|uniref:ABC transporter-associated protein EcsC n=1 Tax=Caulobacter mirabilis TaxID=69666 RepID=A0A2D2B2H6_9CAUL|nr:EcsC family protein [Caulobacter mirabilis]ATQ44428.1 ABC transporter-associated protein EcsC [Caulobacter mirabilis]